MSDINFNKDKEKYEAIEVPKELIMDISKGMKKGKKIRKIRKSIPLCSMATIFLAFFLTVNTSVSFAEAMRNIPIIKDLTNVILVNEGIKYALDEGYIQYINKSCEIDGVKVTITRVIGDKRKLIFGYRVEGQNLKENDFFGLRNVEIVDANSNKPILGSYSYGDGDYGNDGLKPLKNEKYFEVGNIDTDEISKEIIFTIQGIINHSEFIEGKEKGVSDHRFEIPIELEGKIINVEPEIYSINQYIKLGEYSIHINDLKIYPMTIELGIDDSVSNDEKFIWLDNAYIEDEKGKIFPLTLGGGNGDGKYALSFNGGAYKKSKELTLYSKGMYYNPIEKREIIVDLQNKKLVKGGEYGLQLNSIKIYREAQVEGEESRYEVITNEYNYDSMEDTKKEQEKYVFDGVELSFSTISEYEITNVNLYNENSIRYGTSTTEGIVTDASIYFNEEYIKEQEYLYIDISSTHSEKMKTEPFTVKLK